MHVALVTGTRPQIIKSAPVLHALERKGINTSFIHTGQHYDFELADQFIEEFEIKKPDANLEVGSGSSVYHTYEILTKLSEVLQKNTPDYMIVPGDTNSAFSAALTGFKMEIPTLHLESGLRSYDMIMQEEINRRLIDHGAAGLFAPTDLAVKNLERENVRGDVFQTGDTMYDILKNRLPVFNSDESFTRLCNEVGTPLEEYAALTFHRRENVDIPERLREIVKALSEMDFKIVLPLHPRTRQKLKENSLELSNNVVVVPPLSYNSMMSLVSRASLLMTDSGGLQKEAYLLNTPCVTIRDNSEWVETIQAGANVLVSASAEDIIKKSMEMWGKSLKNDPTVYGTGDASEKIADIIAAGEICIKNNIMY